jgi:hypothetical protein
MQPVRREDFLNAAETHLEWQRDMIREYQRTGTGAAFATVDRNEVDAALTPTIKRARSSQNAESPTADLIPTGRPVSLAINSTKSSISSAFRNALCAAGLMQSRSIGMPRISAISRLIFAFGSNPPTPGFAP